MKCLLLLTSIAMLVASSLAAEGPVRHVVAFKFKSGADPAKIKAIEDGFAALKQKISVVQQLEAGTNVSPEKHDKGFTHVWLVTFKNAADRDVYLAHPAHQEFVATLKDVMEDAFVVDYIPEE